MEQPKENKNIIDWALYYRSMGWSVIPQKVVPGKNGKGDKQPLVLWGEFRSRLPEEKEIFEWYKKYPQAGIAIVTGKFSKLLVLDVDVGGDASRFGDLSNTICAKTPSGGMHYYFTYPEDLEIKSSNSKIGVHLDIKAEDGLITAPPTHYAGIVYYEWINSPENTRIAEIPDVLLQEIVGIEKKYNESRNDSHWQRIHVGVPDGERNSSAASYIGKILQTTDQSMWEYTGWDAACKWNENNKPPLDPKELRTVWESIKSKRINELLTVNPENLKELYTKDKKAGGHEIAKFLISQHHIKTTDERVPEAYIYKNGIYVLGGNILGAEIQKILGDVCNTQGKKEIISKIKDLTLTNRDVFSVNENLINLNNGVYDLENNKLIDHDPNLPFLTSIPITFDPSKDCPKIKAFLGEILPPEYVTIIQEWAGYALYRRYPIKKAIIFVGERDSGKSTTLGLFISLVGEKNISGMSLQRIATDKFATSQLHNKHLNIFDDLSIKDIKDNGAFKIATGGSYLGGEYKFGNHFQFKNHSKLTFACNKIPSVADTTDDAYFNRWIIIPFNQQINKPNPRILDEMTTSEELSGFLNFALEGLQRILRNGAFSYKKDPDEIKMEMLKSGSPIGSFAFDCLEQGDLENWIDKEAMHTAFLDYVRTNELPATTKSDFGKKLPKYATYISDSKKQNNTGWRSVRFKTDVAINQGNKGYFKESHKEESEQKMFT